MLHSDPTSLRVLLALTVAVTAALLSSSCAAGDEVTSAAPLGADNAQAGPGQPNPAAAAPPGSINFVVTDDQRGYLDALAGAGIHRSNDLVALSIGSYVCQARAAGQSDQGVWDFVLPLVRGDVHDMNPSATMTAMAPQVRDATAQYIRIATEQLCSGEHSPQ